MVACNLVGLPDEIMYGCPSARWGGFIKAANEVLDTLLSAVLMGL